MHLGAQLLWSFWSLITLPNLLQVDDNLRITELEVHYDPTAFLADLTKGTKSPAYGEYKKGIEGCPYLSSLMS